MTDSFSLLDAKILEAKEEREAKLRASELRVKTFVALRDRAAKEGVTIDIVAGGKCVRFTPSGVAIHTEEQDWRTIINDKAERYVYSANAVLADLICAFLEGKAEIEVY